MRTILDQTRRLAPKLVLLLALAAALALATGATRAREGKRGKTGTREMAMRGRPENVPMTMIQGVLSDNGNGTWSLDGRTVRFARDCSLVDQSRPDGAGRPRSGARAVLMGYARPGVFAVRTGMIMLSPEEEPRANDASRDLVTWSATDPTVGEASPDIPK